MTNCLETRLTSNGVEYHDADLGHIATRHYNLDFDHWGLEPIGEAACQLSRRLFGNLTGLDAETADWLALAMVAQLKAEAARDQESFDRLLSEFRQSRA